MALPFASPDPERAAAARVETLLDLWEAAQRAAQHPPGCPCGTPFAATLDARVIEDQVLEYLQTRYEEIGETRLAAATAGRRAQLLSPTGHDRFADWLVQARHLPTRERELLFDDVERVLQSFEALNGGGFACY